MGSDTMSGGSGADTFKYFSADEAGLGDSHDVITDFEPGNDVIDLSQIDANPLVAGDQAFSWLGTGAFTNVAGQLRYDVISPGVKMVFGDVNGDGVADFQIELQTTSSLAATDFVL